MTKKMTITLEEELIQAVSTMAKQAGKKKTQIIREALQAYLPSMHEDKVNKWKAKNREAIDLYNEKIESQGTFSDDIRLF